MLKFLISSIIILVGIIICIFLINDDSFTNKLIENSSSKTATKIAKSDEKAQTESKSIPSSVSKSVSQEGSYDINEVLIPTINKILECSDNLTVVLDSSCVNQSYQQLDKFYQNINSYKSNVSFALTRDAYYELKLLNSSSHYKHQADLLINICSVNQKLYLLDFSIQDLYQIPRSKISIEDLNNNGSFLFVFNTVSTFDEFIKYVYPYRENYENCQNIYAKNLSKASPYSEALSNCYALFNYKDFVAIKSNKAWLNTPDKNLEFKDVKPIINTPFSKILGKDEIHSIDEEFKNIIIEKQGKINTYNSSSFTNDISNGSSGEALIYTSPENENEYVKIYKNCVPCQNKIDKIIWLMEHTSQLPNDKISLPTGLVYTYNKTKSGKRLNPYMPDNSKVLIGYTMKKIAGEPLSDAYREYYIATELGSYGITNETNYYSDITALSDLLEPGIHQLKIDQIKQILSLCVELKMMDIFFVDIKPQNIMYDSNDVIRFIDCDSFEIGAWPSEGVSLEYTHKDILLGSKENASDDEFGIEIGKSLKEPRYFDFSMAVLIYKILMPTRSDVSIFTTIHTEDSNKKYQNWAICSFPLKRVNSTQNSIKLIDKNVFWYVDKAWRLLLNDTERETLFDIFNFYSIYGLGDLANKFGALE